MIKNGTILIFLLGAALFSMILSASGFHGEAPYGPSAGGREKPIKITILYDNYVHAEGTKADWGYACLIEGMEKTILFDTGTKPEILMHNVRQLKVDLKDVDMVVISHGHGDHTGGLLTVLEKKPGIPVYLPGYFPAEFIERVEKAGGKVVQVKSAESVKLCENAFLTGVMGDEIEEHSLILDTGTDKGIVVITGCSHPGIAEIVKRAKEIVKKNVYIVFGGFHLMRHSKAQVKSIIREFNQMGVLKCGATHCTGDKSIQLFREAFKDNYVKIGTGKIIEIK
jgi:7,8-dihydropterin-6-yl-methyl-4-(beta-D-ribofuranosyl)aminobenzene 5'-phosphate synthase